jgi:tetratricopeptide (TPR) repeat protein
MSVDGLTYELVQKRFRNPVFAHIRTRLSETLGPTWLDDIRALFVREWPEVKLSHELAVASGTQRTAVDDLDLLGVNQLTNLFDKWFDVLVPASAVPVGDAAKRVRARLGAWLTDVKDIRNPNAHPLEADLSVFDALRVADSACRVLQLLQLTNAIHELEQLRKQLLERAAAGVPDLSTAASVLNSLPPREQMYDEFIGRADELEALWRWFADDSCRRWVLVGDGGHGKSAVAYQFAVSVAASNPTSLAAVLWLSAKRRRYSDAQTVPILHPDFSDLASALDRILSDLGWRADVGKTVDAKRDQVLQLLTEIPSLLVVDDLDSIARENEDVVEFFTYEAPKTSSKILVTSRRMYPGMATTSTQIRGLPTEDADTFLRASIGRLGLGDRPDLPGAFIRIREVTECSPLYMEDLLRLCRGTKVSKAIDRWREQGGDNARRYALERERELLSPLARKLLDACCIAGTALSSAQLERIVSRDEEDVQSGLLELERSYLVPQAELVDGVPLFRAHRNLESWLRRELRRDPNTAPLRDAVIATVGLSGTPETGLEADVARQTTVLLRSGRAEEALEIVEKALSMSPNHPTLLALRAETLAKHRPPRMADARRDWARASQLGLRQSERYIRWAFAEEAAGDWRRSAEAALAGIEAVGKNHGRLHQTAGYALSRLGQAQRRALDVNTAEQTLLRAEQHLRRALELERAGGAEYRACRAYRALAINARAMGNAQQLTYWTVQWLADYPDNPDARAEANRHVNVPEVRAALEKAEQAT